MKLLLDAFWRAAAYCLHPRVMLLSILPLVIVGGVAAVLGYFYWDGAVAGVRSAMESWQLLAALLRWLDSIGASAFRGVLAPMVIVAIAVPVVVVLSLLLVAVLMTPALVKLVAARRFPRLERRHGASFWQSALASLGCTLVALFALAVSIPLWFIPPLVLVVPPLIWGWLTYRVMAFDVLAEHASVDERRTILRERRWPLFGMGVVAGYLGAAPSLVWAFSALSLVFAPLLIVVAVWLYTLVFAFSALWFVHYALAALQQLRAVRAGAEAEAESTAPPIRERLVAPGPAHNQMLRG
ncbi:MAG: EI24 domain-containing protein [Pseudomonadota bacterium]|nr:EI24 domain-containing protein [Pseudomonadota bacterium]